MQHDPSGSFRPYTLVYDGTCGVCTRIVDVLAKWDRDQWLEIVASQTNGVHARFSWIPPHAFAESLQLIRIADGKTWDRAAAIEQLLKVLPRGRPIAWLFGIPFVRPLFDGFYRAFARNRHRLDCGAHCGAGASRPPRT